MPVVGFLRSTPATGFAYIVDPFRQGLNDAGFVEGKNVAIEYRWADNQQDRLPGLAADLIRRQVAAIVGAGVPAAQASKAATATTPIVFVIGADPVRVGLVASINRPGGNITGVVFSVVPLVAKLLGMLHELVPKASIIAVLHDPNGPDVESQSRDLEEAARAIGRQILMVNAANERELHAAFAKVVQAGAGGLLISSSVFFISQRRQLVALAARHALPTVYNQREYAEVGGLISSTDQVSRMLIAAPVSTSAGFSRAKSPASCRSISGLNSIWSSTSPPQRHWASKFPPSSSLSPTR
jgi:ABC-type uncharacterized transport system substrate-binding protein